MCQTPALLIQVLVNIRPLSYCRYTLQLYSYGCGQGIYAYGSAAGLVVFKIFSVYFIVGLEVAFHVDKENGNVYQVIPAAATFLQYGAHIIKYTPALSRKIILVVVTMLIGA